MTSKRENHDTRTLFEQLMPAYREQTELLERVHAEQRSRRGIMLSGALPITIVNGQSLNLTRSAGTLAGFAIRETSGAAPALVRLRDGADVNGDLLVPIGLNANESARDWFLPHGIAVSRGVYCEVAAGAIEGVVFFGPASP